MILPKALIYCRVSSRNQEEDGHGLESQETRCRQHAAARGYDVAAVFPDTMTGGGDFMKRKGMVALLSFIDAQPEERFVVIFDDLKRFARDRDFHFRLRDAFRARNTHIECLNFKFDDSPEGEFMETIFAAQGQLERKQNSRQVAQKMRARMENGYWIHNPPVGYRYETIKGHGKVLIPNPPFDGIIRDAFEGYANGRFQSQAELKRFFESFPDFPRNKHGEVKQQRVTDILTQPVYTGYICSEPYGLNWLKGQHEPLISVETFQKVQDRRTGTAKAPKRANIGADFALRGFVCCDGCGVPLRSSWAKGKYKHYAYYLCQTQTCDAYGKSIPRDKVEGAVGEIIKTLQPTEDLFKLAAAMFRVAWDARRAQAVDAIQSGKQQIRDITKQIDTLLERILGTTSPMIIQTYEAKIGDLERAKAIATDQLAKHTEPKGAFEEKLELSLQFLANPWKLWESGQITLRRMVLKLVFADRLKLPNRGC
ncbi:MAG: recombinase family protein [Pseudomonadota bacterium]